MFFTKEHTVCFLEHGTECVRYHLGVRSDETGFFRRHAAVETTEGLCGGQTQRLTAGEGRGGQPPLPRPTAVIGNAKSTALVVIQSTTCRGRQRGGKKFDTVDMYHTYVQTLLEYIKIVGT